MSRTPSSGSGAWAAAGIVIAISLLSAFTARLPTVEPVVNASAPVADPGAAPAGGEAPVAAPAGSDGPVPVPAGSAPVTTVGGKVYDCAKGHNAGATDVGVTAKEIRFAATVVKTGIAKDFLADAQFGMEAVRQKINRQGGVCGRTIQITYQDDGWEPARGQRIIEGWIQSKKFFGLAVNPSSEGVRGAIDSHVIRDAKFPVIGSDGQLIDQYQDPWVWPVATSTASVMHIMARHAWQQGARRFGIVWDQNYRFGVEGHKAFLGSIKRLGGTVTSDVGVQGGQQSYSNQVNDFIGSCGGTSFARCDFVAMLLEPATATRWVGDGGLGNGNQRPRVGIGAPQPLFVDAFARDCGKYCDGMLVWTSFKPPLDPFDKEPAVATYLADLRRVNSKADANNPHVQGAYIGMQLLVEALTRLGPAPTRLGIKAVLDTMTFETGLAPPMRFSKGRPQFPNVKAQAFASLAQTGSFQGWRYANSGFIDDVDAGKDAA